MRLDVGAMRKAKSMAERMQSKIVPNLKTGCWEWTAKKNCWGYGQITVSNRRNKLAHRISYELRHGPIPDGLWVLHRCDNPGCVNPDHLFLGTHEDNMADRSAKDRHFHGETHPMAKLTDVDVRQIRSTTGVTQREIAEQFGVNRSVICRIRNGSLWAKVG